MTTRDWDREELRRLAETSGKPLEVEVAATFQRVWREEPRVISSISLGSYFIDSASDKYRELDVFVEHKTLGMFQGGQVDMRLLVLCSCKGFPPGFGPVTYSLSKNGSPDYAEPSFVCSRRSVLSTDPEFGSHLGATFLSGGYTGPIRRIIGFDTVAEDNISGKPSALKLVRRGDRDIFLEGWDSSVKAALYWADPTNPKQLYARVLIPILVLSTPWWDLPIEEGRVAVPELQHLGYTTNLYPISGSSADATPLTTLVCSREKLAELAGKLKYLIAIFNERLRLLSLKASAS